jgi:hypothetical protein
MTITRPHTVTLHSICLKKNNNKWNQLISTSTLINEQHIRTNHIYDRIYEKY